MALLGGKLLQVRETPEPFLKLEGKRPTRGGGVKWLEVAKKTMAGVQSLRLVAFVRQSRASWIVVS